MIADELSPYRSIILPGVTDVTGRTLIDGVEYEYRAAADQSGYEARPVSRTGPKVLTKKQRDAQRRADGDAGRQPESRYVGIDPSQIPKARGLYELVRIHMNEGRIRNTYSVVARCSGPRCGGVLRTMAVHDWIREDDTRRGCIKCAATTAKPVAAE